MLTQAVYISLVGIGVVFSFLLLIFFLLKGLKLFAVEEKKSHKTAEVDAINKQNQDQNSQVNTNVEEEVVAVIMAVLNDTESIDEGNVIIRKK